MWFGKNIMTKLGLVLAMAVPALAADVAPLEFEGATASDYQAYWNKLMSFKMWGTDSIYLGRAQMPSLSGAIGTANNFTLKDDRHFLGGPIYVGKNFTGGNGTDTIVSGPVRVNETFDAGTNHNVFHGTYCVGAADADAQRDIKNTDAHHYGDTHVDYFGEKGYDAPKGALNEGCSAVEEVPTYLSIPDVKDHPSNAAMIPVNANGDVVVDDVYVIDVPPIDGDEKMYDYYINGSFNIGSSGKLIIRMQSSKSLARFFLSGSFKLASSSIVQVVYVDEGAKYEYAAESHKAVNGSYGKWTNISEEKPVKNKDYAGNLLFHCKDHIVWPSMNGGAYVQGSFLSRDTINLGSNLVLAGQLLATYIIVQNEFDGKSFRYVPFDPPILEPTAGGGNILYEGHTSDNVKIELDKDHENNITFDYCFQFEGTVAVGSDYAMKADIADNLPIYDPATKTCSGTPLSSGFKSGELTLEKPIVLHVEDDDDLEHEFEEFKIWILNLDGAVLANGEHDGYITLKIKDNDAKPFGADYEVIGTEDVPYYFDAFTVTNAKGNAVADYSVKIESLPSAGSLVLVNAAGQDSVILTKGDVIPSSAISSDHAVGKFVLRFEDDDYTEGPAPDPVKAIDRYNFEFRVVDKGNASEEAYKASVLVAPANDAPVAQNTEFTIPENSVTTKTDTTFATSEAKDGAFDATDVDDPVLTYKFDDTFDAENTEDNYNAVTALYGIDPATGKIFLNEGAELDYESADSVHTIRVVITDKSASTGDPADILSTKITATIKIADVEEKPEFPNKNPELKVDENSVKDTEVGAVTAEDDDCKDKNCTVLTYVVVADTNAAHKDDVSEFKIDSKTGMITLVNDSTLNYETKNTYYVLVIAYDGDPKDAKTLSDTARVKIEVQDVNDKPLIENQEFAVVENAKKGTVVDKVVASDEDKWSKLTYAIEDVPDATEEVAKFFSIDADGVITVSADGDGVLDYEVKDTYEIVVIVTDNGEEYGKTIGREFENLSDTAVITIKIKDEDEKPGFDDDYEFAVDENSLKGTKVGTVSANDDDCKDANCSDFVYSLIADENAAYAADVNEFVIDPTSGKITLAKDSSLNYEVKDTYHLRVVAYDGDPKDAKTLSDTALVTVNVQDVNDKPEIKNQEFNVVENAKAGTRVDSVKAADEDKWSKLTYAIEDVPDATEEVAKFFSIDADGVITVSADGDGVLDYEVKDTYEIVVIVTDNGEDKGFKNLSDTAVITIKITDEPEKPGFDDKYPVLAVDENSPKNTEVGVVTADDDDCKDKVCDALTYAVVADTNAAHVGDISEFKIDSKTGKITLVNDSTLDYEKKDTYYVLVIAYDGDPKDTKTLSDTARVKIEVQDVNDKPELADHEFEVPENAKVNQVVDKVNVFDQDTWAKHTFKLVDIPGEEPVANIFSIDAEGVIKVAKENSLNYEVKDTYVFYVIATDNGPDKGFDALSDTATITLKIKDVPEPPYIIPECEGDACIEICKGDKCEVCVGESCHEICVENCDEPYGGDPTKVLTVSVKENSLTGYKVMSYLVTDEDLKIGHTKGLEASLKNTNESGADSLFEASMEKDEAGNWRVVVYVTDGTKLDYEKVKEIHNVTIYVKDKDDPTDMGDSLLRVIKVDDVNEAPVADDATFTPEENLPKGTVIGTLVARDPDSKNVKFSTLTYTIDEAGVPFAIDNKGVITVKDSAQLNYEKNPEFTFHVTVSDGQLSDNAKVTVKLKDVPEKPYIIPDCDGVNCPDNCEGEECGDGKDDAKDTCLVNCTEVNEHKDVPTTIGVKEMTAKDHVVLAYKVADEDVGDVEKIKMEINVLDESTIDNGTKFTDLFEYFYDKTKHQVVVKVKDSDKLDYEALRAKSGSAPDPEYKISIVVNDNRGTETQKDSVIRVIRILDVNEAPSFEVEPCVIAEGNEIGDSLGHVERPSDPDQFSKNPEFYTNYFKLTGGDIDLFDLKRDPNDPMKIVLVAKVKFDCESGEYTCDQDSSYWVELAYGDTTLKTVYSDLKVPVTIRDINEKPTVLTDTVKVKENVPKGTVVDTVKWKDVDKFDSEMQFKIAEDPTDCFDIGSKSGIITVKKDKCSALDYEKTTIIPIKVAVTDSLGKGITVTKPITVKVLDVNEAPSIVKETFVVDEDAKKGSVVDTVKATDPDKDPKYNKLIYKVIGGDTATFKIDSITGIVTLKDTLDYETKNKYEIVVRVFDGEFADTATVPIYVNNKDEKTEVKITLYDDSTKVWHDPDTVYTNSPGRELCWVQGRSDRDLKDTCMNVHIKKDTVIVIRYKDPTTDSYGVDSLVIFFSNAAPVVTIEGDQDANLASNFYTIIENTDKADTNLYVNERKKDVRVTVKDPASKTDTSFVVNLKLETVNVPQKTLDKVNKIVKENSFILNENPKGGVTRTPVNGNEVKVSYKEVLGKDTVTVSYMTDTNGDPVMVPVVNDKGKIDSIEVMTVSYNTVIDGKTVTVSFVVNSVTGEVLVKDFNGTLMESGASKVASSSSSKGNTSSSSSSSSGSTSYVTEGMFQITYSQKDALGNSTTVTYSVNEKGKLVQNSDGDSGYAVSYTYTNKYGNAATQSLYIVLDQKGPTVEILKPVKGQVIRSNYVEVVWTVNGVTQDTLTVQGLDKGPNYIKRFYRDKAGNEAADTVLVIMKDSKDVDIAVVKPVTEMNPEEVKEYYEENPPEEGETFAVSILNPTSGKEVETLKGGTFDTKKGSGEELYPGKDKKHLGPTLALDVKLPTIKDGEGNTGLGGLATLDDLILPNGKISNIGIGIDTSKLSAELKREYKEYTVEEYVEKFCEDGTSVPSDLSKFNMYKTKMQVKIWVYTSLGSFVDYFSFSQDMNDPEYTNDAGKLKMFFEMKPDKDGFVKADNGKLYATGAYLYKVEATIRSTLRCTILDEAVLHDKPNAKRKGDKIKSDDELLKPFGYKRPKTK